MSPPTHALRREALVRDVLTERYRQIARYGQERDYPDAPSAMPEVSATMLQAPPADRAKACCDRAFATGMGTWAHLLTEEFAEAMEAAAESEGVGEPATASLRAELVQVAAVALAWLEAIDARGDR